MYNLRSNHQNYAWGKQGDNSFVSKALKKQGDLTDSHKTYAELWMGTQNPSSIIIDQNNQVSLKDFLNTELPFLMKILSIEKPLSIQVHPTKQFAEVLNSKYPNIYKDSNHKPEIAVVISEKFRCLYQLVSYTNALKLISIYESIFTGFDGIFQKLDNLRSFSEVYTKSKETELEPSVRIKIEESFKNFFFSLIEIGDNDSKIIIDRLIQLCSTNSSEDKMIKDKNNLVLHLFENFGYDKGIICSLFLNLLELNYGDSLFISPNQPHSYIQGECVECMAGSDNTIRLGLTPKFIDVDNFKEMLEIELENQSLEKNLNLQTNSKERYFEFQNFPDFTVLKLTLDQGESYEYNSQNHSILLLLKGKLVLKNLKNEQTLEIEDLEKIFILKDNKVSIHAIQQSEIFVSSSLIY